MSAGYGILLKKAREDKGYKYADVQKITKIDVLYIKALEEEDASAFERAIYMKLFLKTYARFLKLDAVEILAMFAKSNSFPKHEEKKPVERAAELVREETHIKEEEGNAKGFEFTVSNPRNLAILGGGIALLVIIIVLIVMLAGKNAKSADDAKNIYEVPQLQQETMKVAVKAKADVWMKARHDGKEEDFFLKKGQEKEWKGMDRIVFLVGNAAGIEFIVNGDSIGSIGEQGEVINGLVFQSGKNWYIDRNQGFKRDNKPADISATAMPEVVPTIAAAAPAVSETPVSGATE